MTKPIQLLTRIPFDGFYNSHYSDEIDRAEEQWCEWEQEDEEGREGAQPKALRLSEQELAELLMRHTQYGDAYRQVAEWYVDGFSRVIGEAVGVDLGLIFESMDSPREYNFTTDRVYAHVPLKVMRALFKASKEEGHASLQKVIGETFTSRSGFISHYSNRLPEWLEKPLQDWDHNELCTLIEAAMLRVGFEDDDLSLYYATFGDEGGWQAWEAAVDWPAFEAAREEARLDKLDDIEAELSDEERAIREARADWRTGDVWAHAEQLPLI